MGHGAWPKPWAPRRQTVIQGLLTTEKTQDKQHSLCSETVLCRTWDTWSSSSARLPVASVDAAETLHDFLVTFHLRFESARPQSHRRAGSKLTLSNQQWALVSETRLEKWQCLSRTVEMVELLLCGLGTTSIGLVPSTQSDWPCSELRFPWNVLQNRRHLGPRNIQEFCAPPETECCCMRGRCSDARPLRLTALECAT